MAIWAGRILLTTLYKKREIFGEQLKGIVLVHGDTFSTLLGALMGKLARLPVGHIESGLRSFNWFHPFPEELTRILVFRLSNHYFSPRSKRRRKTFPVTEAPKLTLAPTRYWMLCAPS